MALSPISPQELFLQPMSSDVDAGQQQNPVSKEDKLEHATNNTHLGLTTSAQQLNTKLS